MVSCPFQTITLEGTLRVLTSSGDHRSAGYASYWNAFSLIFVTDFTTNLVYSFCSDYS